MQTFPMYNRRRNMTRGNLGTQQFLLKRIQIHFKIALGIELPTFYKSAPCPFSF